MSAASLDRLEESVRLIVDTASRIHVENVKLERENKKLVDQLDDALDEIHTLRRQIGALQGAEVSR
jgi:FtsZ-binding cell division protein ZapB